MTRTTFNPFKKANFYRCPACGELVDNRQREAIRLHHDHVLHPPRYGKFPTALPPAVATRSASRL